MKAKKANKVYRIDESQKIRYLKDGYDVYDDDGNILEYSPLKTIKYSDHVSAMNALREELGGTGEEDGAYLVDVLKDYGKLAGIDVGQARTALGILKKIKEHKEGGTDV